MVFQDHITLTAMPTLYIQGLGAEATIRVDVGQSLDTELFTPGTPQTIAAQEAVQIDLPTGAFNLLNKVAVLRVISGKVSADLRTPVPVRSYLRQPGEGFGSATMRSTTGRNNGWPTSPAAPAL